MCRRFLGRVLQIMNAKSLLKLLRAKGDIYSDYAEAVTL